MFQEGAAWVKVNRACARARHREGETSLGDSTNIEQLQSPPRRELREIGVDGALKVALEETRRKSANGRLGVLN